MVSYSSPGREKPQIYECLKKEIVTKFDIKGVLKHMITLNSSLQKKWLHGFHYWMGLCPVMTLLFATSVIGVYIVATNLWYSSCVRFWCVWTLWKPRPALTLWNWLKFMMHYLAITMITWAEKLEVLSMCIYGDMYSVKNFSQIDINPKSETPWDWHFFRIDANCSVNIDIPLQGIEITVRSICCSWGLPNF